MRKKGPTESIHSGMEPENPNIIRRIVLTEKRYLNFSRRGNRQILVLDDPISPPSDYIQYTMKDAMATITITDVNFFKINELYLYWIQR